MTRRMTRSEATELLEQCFNVSPEPFDGLVEAYVPDMTVDQAQCDIESYIAYLTRDEFDPAAIEVKPDATEDGPATCVRIVIHTEEDFIHG